MIDTDRRRKSIIDRIVERCTMFGMGFGCWIWNGPTSGSGRGGGYARMSLNGRTVAVHKVVFTHFFGYIPGNRQVDHICNNRNCVNPLHLQLVSHKRNCKLRDERRANEDSPDQGGSA